MCGFQSMSKSKKMELKKYLEAYECRCGLPLFPDNNIGHAHLDFGSNILETNHNITCDNLIERHMDHIFTSCTCCGNKKLNLDVGSKCRPMCHECSKSKVKVINGNNKTNMNNAIKDDIDKIKVKRKQITMDFPTCDDKKKKSPAALTFEDSNIKCQNTSNSNKNDEVKLVKETKSALFEKESEREFLIRRDSATKMLGFKTHDVAGLGDCQLLAVCRACFGKKRYDELNKNSKIIHMKWSMMNLFENNNEDPVLKSIIINWRKHVIGDCLPSRLCMNDITIEWLSIMFNQIIIILHRPIAEKDMVGEMCEPISDFSSRRSALFYKDNQLYYNETKCRETRTTCPIFE